MDLRNIKVLHLSLTSGSLAGAVIAIKDMNEHYYLAVEEKGTNSGIFRLVGVLHFSLVGDRALFKVLSRASDLRIALITEMK